MPIATTRALAAATMTSISGPISARPAACAMNAPMPVAASGSRVVASWPTPSASLEKMPPISGM